MSPGAQAHAHGSRASAPIGTQLRSARALTPTTDRNQREEPPHDPSQLRGGERSTVKDINKQIAAQVSWSRTTDRSARTRPARQAFLGRFEREVDPNGVLPPAERSRRAQHALRAYMLRLAKRSVVARRSAR